MNDTNECTPENTDSTECCGAETTEECTSEPTGDCATAEAASECCEEATADAGGSDDAGECCGDSDDSCSDSA